MIPFTEDDEDDLDEVPEELARFVAAEWTAPDGEPLPLREARRAFMDAWWAWTMDAGTEFLHAMFLRGAARRHATDPSWPMPRPWMSPHPTPLKRSDRRGPALGHPWEWS